MSGAGVTEPDAVRAAGGGGKKARAHYEHPEPVSVSAAWNERIHGVIPKAAAGLLATASDGSWAADVRHSRGTTDPGETREGVLVDACAVRLARGGSRMWAAWWRPEGGVWKFMDAQLRGVIALGEYGVEGACWAGFPMSATEVGALAEMPPIIGTPCTGEVYERTGRPHAWLIPISGVRDLIGEHLAGRKVEREAAKAEAAARKVEREAARVERMRERRAKIAEMLGSGKPLKPDRAEKLRAELAEIEDKLAFPVTHAAE